MEAARRVLIPVADDYEDLEVWYPAMRLQAAGIHVVMATPNGKGARGKHGYPLVAEAAIPDVKAADFQGVMVPGGWAPDTLRRIPHLLQLVRDIDERSGLVASICHGPWVLISARILKGRKVTSTPGIRDDLENAGAVWRDDAVVEDHNLITSRRPADLPAFGEALTRFMTRA
jgi:protease I